MRNNHIAFTVKLAGIPARINCSHQENQEFFADYLTTEEPAFEVEIADEDIEFSLSLLNRFYGDFGGPYSDCFLENCAIQHVLSKELLDYDVLLFHGSALCMDGDAYIFTAPSGTGKSTHARFWRETFGDRVWMLNDDKPMIRIENGKAIVYGTPWDGKHRLSTNASAPLKAIIWLKRGDENHIEPLSKPEMFPVLMGQGAWSKRGPLKPKAMQLEARLLDTAEFYQLSCNMDPDAARVAWEGMQNPCGRACPEQ